MTDHNPPEPEWCCPLRKKVLVAIVGIVPEEVCGVSDTALLDVYDPDNSTQHTPRVRARFCMWCGADINRMDTPVNITRTIIEEVSDDLGDDDPASIG